MTVFTVRRSHLAVLFGSSLGSAALAVVVAIVPACNPDDWRWLVADLALLSVCAVFLAWQGKKLIRLSLEITSKSLVARSGRQVSCEILFESVGHLTNKPKFGGVEVRSRMGPAILIPYHLDRIDELVDILEARTGRPLEHQP